MRTLISITLFMLISGLGYAQQNPSAEAILQASTDYYKAVGDFEVSATYSVYRGLQKTELLGEDNTVSQRRGNNFYTQRTGVEYLVADGKLLTIDHNKKAMQLLVAPPESAGVSYLDVSAYLQYFEKKTVKDLGDRYRVYLSTPILTQLPYTEVMMEFSKDNFALLKQDLLLASRAEYTDNEGNRKQDFKRLVITVNDFKTTGFSVNIGQLEVSHYAALRDSKWTPQEAFAGYRIIDKTIN